METAVKPVTKDIMTGVNKAKAQAFMVAMKTFWNGRDNFQLAVVRSLACIGIMAAGITNGTANAVVCKMEKKSGIDFV